MIITKDVTAEAADVFLSTLPGPAGRCRQGVSFAIPWWEKKGEFDGSTISDYGG